MAAIGGILLFATVWSLFEAQWLRLHTIEVHTTRMAAGSKPLRVAMMSDVHLGLIEREGRVEAIARLMEKAKPDLIVSDGDLVDGAAADMNDLADRLAQLKAPLGKYAVLGNHEWYVGLPLQRSVFTGGRVSGSCGARAVSLPDGALLAGVDDPAGFGPRPPDQGGRKRDSTHGA